MATSSHSGAAAKAKAVSASDFKQWLHAMKMVARLPGGMPPEFRHKLWLALAEQHLQTKTAIDWPREEARCMCADGTGDDDEELGIQIVKDLHRTGSSLCSGPAGSLNQSKLKRVLMGYARWNPEVGYCQGFNMLGALILQVMDKDDIESLKVMIYLIEGVLPPGYFNGSLGGLQADMAVFRDLLGARLPKLARHLQRLQGGSGGGGGGGETAAQYAEPPLTNVFTMQWFLTLFCTCLPFNCVLRVWDLVLIEGSDVLLRTALAIWGLLEERILAVKTADDFYCRMGMLSGELLNGHLFDSNGLIQKVVDLGPIAELQKMRDKHLYNVTPWKDKRGLRFLFADDETDSDDESASSAWTLRLGGVRRSSFGLPAPNITTGSARSGANATSGGSGGGSSGAALDIGLLKRQYDKLRERQRQAHIILTSTARQTVADAAGTAAASLQQQQQKLQQQQQQQQQQEQQHLPVQHYLMGRSAIVSSKGRRLGPPTGAVPPIRTKALQQTTKTQTLASSTPGIGKASSKVASTASTARRDSIKPTASESAHSSEKQRRASAESIAERSARSVSYRTSRKRSESSSYSDDSDGAGGGNDNDNDNDHSSTSTSLCDEDNAGATARTAGDSTACSSLEASPAMRRRPNGAEETVAAGVDVEGVVDAAAATDERNDDENTAVIEMLRTAKLDECISELNKLNLCGNCEVISCEASGSGECGAVTLTVVLEEEEEIAAVTSVAEDKDGMNVIVNSEMEITEAIDDQVDMVTKQLIDVPFDEKKANNVDNDDDEATKNDDASSTEPPPPFSSTTSFEKYLQINFPSTYDTGTPQDVPSTPTATAKSPPSSTSPVQDAVSKEPFVPATSPPTHVNSSIIQTSPTTTSVPTLPSLMLPPLLLFPQPLSNCTITDMAASDASKQPAITSTSQLSPIADFSKYLSTASSISPLRTPSIATAYLDCTPELLSVASLPNDSVADGATATAPQSPETSNNTGDGNHTVQFRVNDDGVTNEYFERVTGAPERPTRLELRSSTSDDGPGTFANDDLTRDVYAKQFVADDVEVGDDDDDVVADAAAVDDVFDAATSQHVFMKEKSISLDEPWRENVDGARDVSMLATSCPENETMEMQQLAVARKQSERVNRIIEENSRILHSLLRKNGQQGANNIDVAPEREADVPQIELAELNAVDGLNGVMCMGFKEDAGNTPKQSTASDAFASEKLAADSAVDSDTAEISQTNLRAVGESLSELIAYSKQLEIDHSARTSSSSSSSQNLPDMSKPTALDIIINKSPVQSAKSPIETLETTSIISSKPQQSTADSVVILPAVVTAIHQAPASTTNAAPATDIADTLSSIKNTIRSIDSLCQKDSGQQRSRIKTMEIIESLNEFRYRKGQITAPQAAASSTSTPPNTNAIDASRYTSPAVAVRNSRPDARRELSPRRQSRFDADRDECINNVLTRAPGPAKSRPLSSANDLCQFELNATTKTGCSARYSLPPGAFGAFETSPTTESTATADSMTTIAPPATYSERRLEIRHTTVTSTFYDRFLSQKQETRRSQLNVRLQHTEPLSRSPNADDRSCATVGSSSTASSSGAGVPAVITQAYLDSLRLPDPGSVKTTSTVSITRETSPIAMSTMMPPYPGHQRLGELHQSCDNIARRFAGGSADGGGGDRTRDVPKTTTTTTKRRSAFGDVSL